MIAAALSGAALGFLVSQFGYRRGWSLARSVGVALLLWLIARGAAWLFSP